MAASDFDLTDIADPDSGNSYDFLFDEDKAKKAAKAVKIFQDVSVGSTKEKMREEGRQQRESAAQAQEFSQQDEARDYGQAQRAYRF